MFVGSEQEGGPAPPPPGMPWLNGNGHPVFTPRHGVTKGFHVICGCHICFSPCLLGSTRTYFPKTCTSRWQVICWDLLSFSGSVCRLTQTCGNVYTSLPGNLRGISSYMFQKQICGDEKESHMFHQSQKFLRAASSSTLQIKKLMARRDEMFSSVDRRRLRVEPCLLLPLNAKSAISPMASSGETSRG